MIKINTVLYTKDGRKIGNAIVNGNTHKGYMIITDHGNTAGPLIAEEIEELFYIGAVDDTHKNAARKIDPQKAL